MGEKIFIERRKHPRDKGLWKWIWGCGVLCFFMGPIYISYGPVGLLVAVIMVALFIVACRVLKYSWKKFFEKIPIV